MQTNTFTDDSQLFMIAVLFIVTVFSVVYTITIYLWYFDIFSATLMPGAEQIYCM